MTARSGVALATVTNAVASVLSQFLALVLLGAAEYGRFALIYLFFGLATSVMLSSVSESWARTRRGREAGDDWSSYGAVCGYLALVMGAIAAAVALVAGIGVEAAVATAIAVTAASFRVGARYFEVHEGRNRRTVLADLAVILTLCGFWSTAIARGSVRDVDLALWAWALAGTASVALGTWPRLRGPRVLVEWVGQHGKSMRVLQGESILMDLGSMVTPLLLIPLLSISSFGVYRAVSSVAAPVRLLLNPLRPALARVDRGTIVSGKVSIAVIGVGVAISAVVGATLALIGAFRLPWGTLAELSPYVVPVCVYVLANMVGHFYYLGARMHATGTSLLTNRVIQTVLVSVLPLLGALTAGLWGAIWGLAVATAINAIAWSYGVRRGA